MTDVWSQCMWHVFDGYQCSELILLCINLGLYMPNKCVLLHVHFSGPVGIACVHIMCYVSRICEQTAGLNLLLEIQPLIKHNGWCDNL
jgi:hypothetical protein